MPKGDESRWFGTPEDLEWQKREKKRLREESERTWGHKLAEYGGSHVPEGQFLNGGIVIPVPVKSPSPWGRNFE
jgi:hypothetical protein